MKKSKWIWAVLVAVCFTLGPGLCRNAESAEKKKQEKKQEKKEERIAVSVNGVKFSERDVQEAIDLYLPSALYHSPLTPEKREEYRPKAIDSIVKQELFYQQAKKEGMSIPKAELDDTVKKLKARFRSEADFEKGLKAKGWTMKEFERQSERTLLIKKFANEKITVPSKVTDEFLREYYESNRKDFLRPEAVRVRHILIKVPPLATKEEREKLKQEAEEIRQKAKAGEDFGGLASMYSKDDFRVKGGDLGLVHRGRLDPALDEVVFKMEPGQISEIVQTDFGYHIVKFEEKLPPTQIGYNEVKEKLKAQQEKKRLEENEASILKRLKENAKIEIY